MTERGRIETELVVNACGMWAPQVVGDGRRLHAVGAGRPPAHRAARGRRATSSPTTCRASATPTTWCTAGRRPAACCSAATSPTRRRAGWTACRGITAEKTLPADPERFDQLMQGAARRFPFLEDAGVVALVCHPDAMTPDGNPLLGEMPGRARLLGRRGAVAERLRRRRRAGAHASPSGSPPARPSSTPTATARGGSAPRTATRARSRPPGARCTGTTTGCATRSTPTSGAGPTAPSPLHERLQDEGAVFGAKNGWERPDYFQSGAALAAGGRRPARVRLEPAAVLRPARGASTPRCASAPG